MDRDRFEVAAQIFADAAALSSEQQKAFVENACAGDNELLIEVHSLLAAAVDADDYFVGLAERLGVASSPSDDASTADTDQMIGRRGLVIGAYTLTEPIGSGGTGTVWRADRTDGQFEGQVAIKIVNPAATSVAAVSRLADEAQHLAKLSHPNIARLLDAGIDGDNSPYLVLEIIDGTPIDRYCDAHYLDVNKRILLFFDVLRAVAHAHAHLIVHRDIKPSNVLVDEGGNVKLLDFGIAKLLRTESDAPGAGSTVELAAALTPEYAAPEQLLGQTITTSTDVYALGLMLYELLSGRNPRDARMIGSFAALVEVATQDPPKASTIASHAEHRATSRESLRRALRGDLDNVLQKALAPEPEARYSSATEFKADLEHFLKGEPVSAMPPTIGYRAQRFVGRHRGGVLVAALTTITLIAAMIVTAWQSVEARRQRDAAIYQQQRAQATNEFLSLLIGEVGPEGEALSLQQLLDRGVKLIDRQYGGNERFVARTLYDISILYASIGQVEKQTELLDRIEEISRSTGDNAMLATALCARSRMQHVSDPAIAAKHLAVGKAAAESSTDPNDDLILECYRAEGLAYATAGDNARATEVFESALRAMEDRQVVPANSRLTLLNDLAEQYMKTGRASDALRMMDSIIQSNKRIGRGGTVGHVIYLANRGAVLARLGEVAAATESLRDAHERVIGMDKPLLGIALHYGGYLERLAQYDEALRILEPEYKAAEESGNVRWLSQLSMIIGRALVHTDRADEADAYLNRAERVFNETPAAHQRQLVYVWLARTEDLLIRGNIESAQHSVEQGLAALGYPEEKKAASLSSALVIGARVALEGSDPATALEYANDAYDVAASFARDVDRSADVGQALLQRARARDALGERASAVVDMDQALISLTNGLGGEHPDTVAAANELARLHQRN